MDSQKQCAETTATEMEPELAFEQAVPEHLGMDESILNEVKTFALQKGGAGCVLRGRGHGGGTPGCVLVLGIEGQSYGGDSIPGSGHLQGREGGVASTGLECLPCTPPPD